MFAIAFDMDINALSKNYGEPYLSNDNDMLHLVQAMNALKSVSWFKDSVRDIRAFRVEDWSDFTPFFKD